MSTARRLTAGFGTYTSSICAGGLDTPTNHQTAKTEIWNGTSWTEVNDLNTARRFFDGSGADNTSGIVFGGTNFPSPTTIASTEDWNGSSWQETSDLNTGRGLNAGSDLNATNALTFGGNPGLAATEEWSSTSNTDKTISTD